MTIGAIASVIAGAYYMYGSKDGEAKRKQISAWSLKMKAEVLQGIEKLKDVSEPKYKEIVKKVSEKYKQVDKGELKKVVDEMMTTWNKMKKEVAAEIAKKEVQIARENKSKTSDKSTTTKIATKKVVAKRKKPTPKAKTSEAKKIESTPDLNSTATENQ